ncbi:type II toxin-antitoxin system VapC family toxin [Aquisalimonas sp.]|uniref:type II toxin-antitoxin system VapC family toxin n=1 Tax=Aquisalimonas sp. TaxID=1872621 RepID=UPI0025C1420F|nr:type II toxin-antitoxin system VapC family toxin [Aquisalimonas sp.]
MGTRRVYLIDTNVISEARKGRRANPGIRRFFDGVVRQEQSVFLSVVTVGELRRGVDLIRHRGDEEQAIVLEKWLTGILNEYGEYILDIDVEVAQVWGRLRVPGPENALDKQIAATALIHDLIVVTHNESDFDGTGVQVLNPF